MYIVLVHVHVKNENIADFITATLENARNSLKEPGIARFDIIQNLDDPARFTLVEVYRSEVDAPKHKETKHYLKWRDTVADMMVEPRLGVKYTNLFPLDKDY